MDIKADIERVRSLMNTLQNWDLIVKEKQLDAMWGKGSGFDDVKVQTTAQHDRMENAIIKLQSLEEHRNAIFEEYWSEKTELERLINQYANVDDITILHRYMIGCDLSQIPLKGKQKNPQSAVDGAIRRLQKTICREEEIARQPEGVRKLIRGEKKKCKHCENGYIKYMKEESDRFIFVCDGCGRRLKADKIGAQNDRRTTFCD